MKLTKRAFIQWLREQKPGRRFKLGTGNEPLLQWACETAGYSRMGYSWLPWTVRFLGDQAAWTRNSPRRTTITAAECLRLLGEK